MAGQLLRRDRRRAAPEQLAQDPLVDGEADDRRLRDPAGPLGILTSHAKGSYRPAPAAHQTSGRRRPPMAAWPGRSPDQLHQVARGERQAVGRRPLPHDQRQLPVAVAQQTDLLRIEVGERPDPADRPGLGRRPRPPRPAPTPGPSVPARRAGRCRTGRPTSPRPGRAVGRRRPSRSRPPARVPGRACARRPASRARPARRRHAVPAAAGANTSRPSNVVGSPVAPPPAVPDNPDGGSRATARRMPPARAAAARSSPLSGPTNQRRSGPSVSSTTPAPWAADPRVDDGQDDPRAEVGHRPDQGRRAGPDVVRRDLVGEVDDRDARRQPAQHRMDDADELVGQAVVGEEVDRVGARSGPRLHRRPGAGQPAFVSRSPR